MWVMTMVKMTQSKTTSTGTWTCTHVLRVWARLSRDGPCVDLLTAPRQPFTPMSGPQEKRNLKGEAADMSKAGGLGPAL